MNNSNTRLKSSMNLGLILGGVLVILHLIFWFMKIEGNKFAEYLNYIAIAALIVWGTKSYRDQEMGGEMRYGQALSYGTLSGFFSAIIYGFYFYIFITFLDTEYLERMLLLLEEGWVNAGFSDEQIDSLLIFQEKLRSPVLWSISSILTFSFLGFIISLITSIFIKKEGDPFNKTRMQIDNKNN
ncbi:DUF4199 domain-containing protein [Bacteroidota bacterium]